ncbi:unnamed protein product [Peronospora destructor]|uniref:Uncharacterized protein n=1 Tax=Peronospora destructor TaxID=86335 RepID=A0AAV0VFV9_9STRA|nr:unnamed protein product [Peronospora destructor]
MVKFFIPGVLLLVAFAATAAAYVSHLRFHPKQSLSFSSQSSTKTLRTAHQRNIDEINRLNGYDVVIVCTSTPHQAQYWQDRLMATRGTISPKDAKVIAVFSDVYWWDYGQLTLYLKNNRLVTKPGVESDCLRSFLGISNNMEHSNVGVRAVINEATVLNSEIEHGDIKHRVLSGVCAKEVNADGSILINVTARSITALNCVVYNVTSDEVDGLCLGEGSVVVGVLLPDGKKVVMHSNTNVCGRQAWKTVLQENQYSFKNIYELNADANVSKLEKLIQDEHMKMRAVVMS